MMGLRRMMIAGASGGGGDDYAAAVLASEPAAWWRFSEPSGAVVACIGSEPATGTITGGIARGPSLCGDSADHCGVWPAATAYVLAGNSAYLQTANNFTYEAIVEFSPLYGATSISVMSHGQGGPLLSITAAGGSGGGRLRFVKSYISERGVGSRIMLPGIRYHVAVHVETGGVSRCFVNGHFDATLTTASDYGAAERGFYIGIDTNRNGEFSAPWIGSLDEVAVYRRALPETELRAHAAAAGLNSVSG